MNPSRASNPERTATSARSAVPGPVPVRVLLVGGTSETRPVAEVLLAAGHAVLVSQATEVELDLPEDPRLAVRRGRLDRDGFRQLAGECAITHVVDASHPFAVDLHRELEVACAEGGIPRIRYERPAEPPPAWVEIVPDHAAAAMAASVHGLPILLTTGSRHLAPYAEAARRAGIPLFARVLPGEESSRACRGVELPSSRIEFARGPFSVERTRALLRRWGIGVLVAKDGGAASGLVERLEAARREGVAAVLVRRPDPESGSTDTFAGILERIRALPEATAPPRSPTQETDP